jgi:hypothetical protein
MAALIEVYSGDDHLQLSDEQIYFRLEGKVELDASTAGWAQYGNGSFRDVTFTGPSAADWPMLALSSDAGTWAKLIASSAGSLTYRITRTAAQAVTLFLFSARRPPDDVGELIIYADYPVVAFNSSYPVARPLGTYSATGYKGVPIAGRRLAHVPQKQETASFNLFQNQGLGTCTFNGQPAYNITNRTGWAERQVVAGNAALGNLNISVDVGPVQYMCSQFNQTPQGASYGSGGWSSLILDVTGL